MTQGMQQSLHILHIGNREIATLLHEEAARNPFLSVSPRRGNPSEYIPEAVAENLSMATHVETQIGLHFRDPFERAFAMHLAAALEPTGWLGRPLEELAQEMAMPLPAAEVILKHVQEFDPPGLFARNLRECLEIQARDAGLLSRAVVTLLANLDLIAENDIGTLMKNNDISSHEVAEALKLIRSFDPKPGLRFSHDLVAFMPCDLVVTEVEDGWRVEVNDDALPAIKVDTSPLKLANRRNHRALVELSRTARDLERMVRRRQETLLKVGAAIVARQHGFLQNGWIGMLPLSLADISQDTGLHSSTISRAVSSTMIETPRGTISLRAFFARSVKVGDDAAVAQSSLSALINRIITEEDPDRPLTDEQVADLIFEMNLKITRRTIANHRKALKIPTAAQRRRINSMKHQK